MNSAEELCLQFHGDIEATSKRKTISRPATPGNVTTPAKAKIAVDDTVGGGSRTPSRLFVPKKVKATDQKV